MSAIHGVKVADAITADARRSGLLRRVKVVDVERARADAKRIGTDAHRTGADAGYD